MVQVFWESSDVEMVSQENKIKADRLSDILKCVWFQISYL